MIKLLLLFTQQKITGPMFIFRADNFQTVYTE